MFKVFRVFQGFGRFRASRAYFRVGLLGFHNPRLSRKLFRISPLKAAGLILEDQGLWLGIAQIQ